ncbi:MAG: sulfur carrier protein ThiS [Myxococcales bacterium]|nr:sulfur carrier protein ThiS [Myxococcales bacterium]MCB9534469.1 sulfur carrier protein ThiS [Myxococcales bacterium]
MEVSINGAPLRLRAGATLPDALATLGIGVESRGVAVALDGEVVPRSRWQVTHLVTGSRVEVVSAAQGG